MKKEYKEGCMSKAEIIEGIYKMMGQNPIICNEAIHLIKCQSATLENFIDAVELAKKQIKENK